jgi:hypothetical protein
MYEALGLCKVGEAHKMVESGDNTVCHLKLQEAMAD